MTEPYYRDDLVTLYLGDSRDFVDQWTGADVLVTDPPYGREWRQREIRTRGDGRTAACRPHGGIGSEDDDTAVRDEALELWGERRAVVFGDLTLAPPAGTKQTGVYRKPADAGMRGAVAGRRRDVEAIYYLGPWPTSIGGASSVIETAARNVGNPGGLAARYGHPHAKPLDVMAELVGLVPHGEVVADPFAGAGSTLVAAQLAGLRCVGVEREEAYCERAARRLSQGGFVFGASA